ncbi:Golgi-associated plant pathogenesis-related protein 1-like [Saccoglossus kowalevskii]
MCPHIVLLKPYYDNDGCFEAYGHAPYRCADNEPICLRENELCDGFQNCEDNSDELGCGYGEADTNLCIKPNQSRVTDWNTLENQLLEAHNYFRCLHGVNPLVWDDRLAKYGQYLASSNAARGRLEHSYVPDFGENVAMQELKSMDRMTGYGFVSMFYNEIKLYDFRHPQFSYDTGHFTQVIWKETKKIGCGASLRYRTHWTQFHIACEYYPQGNIFGKSNMAANVPPLM